MLYNTCKPFSCQVIFAAVIIHSNESCCTKHYFCCNFTSQELHEKSQFEQDVPCLADKLRTICQGRDKGRVQVNVHDWLIRQQQQRERRTRTHCVLVQWCTSTVKKTLCFPSWSICACCIYMTTSFGVCVTSGMVGRFGVEISAMLEELHWQVFVDEGSAGVDNQLCMRKDSKKEFAFFLSPNVIAIEGNSGKNWN